MSSLSGANRKDALLKIGLLCKLRHCNQPDDEIAVKLGFSSADMMHKQLERWGVPEWLVYEEPPTRGEGAWLPERRRRASGPEEDLPLADNAAPLFREALRSLRNDVMDLFESLERGVDSLPHRREVLQADQFRVNYVDDAGFSRPTGTSWAPAEPLPTLIAVYLLMGRPLEPLLKALHGGSAEPDRQRITTLVEDTKRREGKRWAGNDGLRRVVHRIASLVRGSESREGGRRPPDVLPMDQNEAQRMTELDEGGASEEEIRDKPRRLGYAEDDITRLKNLRFRRPKT